MNKVIFILPLLAIISLLTLFVQKILDDTPLNIIERPLPEFELKEVNMHGGLVNMITNDDMPNRPYILNIFASWCVTHIIENANLSLIAKDHNIPIYGIIYKDKEDRVKRSLSKMENPYTKLAIDPKGTVVSRWGIENAPQSFIIDSNGIIRYHFKDTITAQDIDKIILPIMEMIE